MDLEQLPIGEPIKRSEIDSLPIGAPIKRSELGGVTPTEAPQESTLGQIVGFAKGVFTEDIPNMAKGAVGAVSGAYNTLQRAGDIYQNDPSLSGIPGVGQIQALGRAATEGMTGDDLKRMGIRTGGGVGGAVLGGLVGGPIGAVVLGALGTQFGGEVNEEIGLEPNTSWLSWEKAKQLRGNVSTGLIVPAVSNMAFKTAAKAGRFMSKHSFSLNELKKEAARRPGKIATDLSIGARRIPSERILFEELRDGEATFIKSGVIQNSNSIDDMIGNLNRVVKENSNAKNALITRIDDTVAAANQKGASLPLIEFDDIKPPKVIDQITKRRNTGIGRETAAEQAALLKEVEDQFQTQVSTGPNGPILAKTPKTLREVQDMLDVTYEELRKMKHFDDAARASGTVNESVLNQNLARMEFYQDLSKSLRGAIAAYPDRIKKALPKVLDDVPAGELGRINRTISELIPYRTALERFSVEAMEVFVRDTGRSIRNQNPFSGPGAMGLTRSVDALAKPVTEPIVEASRMRSALDYEPNVVQDLKTIAGVRTGQITADPFGSMARGAVEGASNVAATMGDAMTSPIGRAATINTLDFFSDPLFEQHVSTLPLPEDVKAELLAAKNGTPRVQLNALGKAKVAAKGQGIFDPSPIPGVASFIPEGENAGKIADPIEREYIRDVIGEKEADPIAKAELLDNLNRDGTLKRIPDYLLMQLLEPAPTATPETPALTPETVEVGDGLKRQSYDY